MRGEVDEARSAESGGGRGPGQAPLLLLLALGACQPAARVTLTLDKAPGVVPLRGVVVVLRETATDTPTVYGPVDLKETPEFRLQADVAPGEEFYFDVFGCADAATCQGEQVLARGCMAPRTLEKGQEESVTVTLYQSPGEYDLPPGPGITPETGCPPVGPHTRPPPP
ncbi:MAG: hypothetical protein HY904_08310 [Deltaproteobacteria bacterium]|nr:hypothetical protein [Deltaproteobacteria bacterium]